MKVAIVVVVAVLAVAFAKPAAEIVAPVARIISSDFDQQPEGAYSYGFETDNSISRQETGELKTIKDEEGADQDVLVVRGSYRYIDPVDGQEYKITYFADETGFHAEGDHIPKPARK